MDVPKNMRNYFLCLLLKGERWSSYHTASGQQFRGIKDTVLEAMIDKQRTEFDADKRAGLMFEIQKYLAQKMYLIPTERVADQFYFRWPWVLNEG